MVPKADGSLRLCTDFRKINSCTVPDHFPLPRIEDLMDHVGKTKTYQIGHDQRLLAGSIGSHFRICHPVRPFPVALYAVRASQCPCHLFSASHQVTDGLGCLLCCLLGRHLHVGRTPFPPTYCPVAHSIGQSKAQPC